MASRLANELDWTAERAIIARNVQRKDLRSEMEFRIHQMYALGNVMEKQNIIPNVFVDWQIVQTRGKTELGQQIFHNPLMHCHL